jgi:hypothetical protein
MLCLLGLFGFAKAQEVSPVDFMRLNPYQLNTNPAADLPYRGVLSLALGNMNTNVVNTGIRYDNLFEFDAQGRPSVIDLHKFADAMHSTNDFSFDFNDNLFFLGCRLNKGMLTVGYNLRVDAGLKYNDGLFKLIAYGNGAFVGEDQPAVIDLNLSAKVYEELAVGYQINVSDRLSLGARAKVIFGLANINTDVCNAKLVTDPDSYALRLYEDVAVRASLPLMFNIENCEMQPLGNFAVADLFRNKGFGIDLGVEYHINDRFGLVAAVNDLGYIRWDANNYLVTSRIADVGQYYDEGSFFFEGMDVEQIQLIASDESYRDLFLDTLQQYFQLDFDNDQAYNTMLNTNCLVRGYFDITPSNRFTAQLQGQWTGSNFRPAATVAYCGTFWNCLSLCATYTATRNSYDNFGLGIGARLGVCHVYVATNNIKGFIDPLNSTRMNAQAGIVFHLMKRNTKSIEEPATME